MFNLLFSQPLVFAAWVLAFLIALSVHEFAHAWVGLLLGDTTAQRGGRLTLNPAAHIDPIGFFAVLLIGFGWGKPVPYNPYNLKWPRWGPVAIALAGPLSNFLLAIVSIIALSFISPFFPSGNLLVILLDVCAQLNVALMVFNLIPLPPLDGSKVLLAFLAHPKYTAVRTFIESRGPMLLLFLILADALGGFGIFVGLFQWAIRIVASIATFHILL